MLPFEAASTAAIHAFSSGGTPPVGNANASTAGAACPRPPALSAAAPPHETSATAKVAMLHVRVRGCELPENRPGATARWYGRMAAGASGPASQSAASDQGFPLPAPRASPDVSSSVLRDTSGMRVRIVAGLVGVLLGADRVVGDPTRTGLVAERRLVAGDDAADLCGRVTSHWWVDGRWRTFAPSRGRARSSSPRATRGSWAPGSIRRSVRRRCSPLAWCSVRSCPRSSPRQCSSVRPGTCRTRRSQCPGRRCRSRGHLRRPRHPVVRPGLGELPVVRGERLCRIRHAGALRRHRPGRLDPDRAVVAWRDLHGGVARRTGRTAGPGRARADDGLADRLPRGDRPSGLVSSGTRFHRHSCAGSSILDVAGRDPDSRRRLVVLGRARRPPATSPRRQAGGRPWSLDDIWRGAGLAR